MAEQILTLMADFDEESQQTMGEWYEKLEQEGFIGKQTKGLPFHISLGTFALDKEQAVIQEMKRLAASFDAAPVHVSHIGVLREDECCFAVQI